jgi:hypothetical protein
MLSFDMSRLVSAGLAVDGVEVGEAGVILAAHHASARGGCPDRRTWSARIRSGYKRKLNDLPIGGRRVQIVVLVRRFFCDAPSCHRLTYAERFDGVVAPKARRTSRLVEIVFCPAIALGGRPAALAKRIEIEVSNDTLLRAVRRRGLSESFPPSVIGIDDWAWRRNFRYGTVGLCPRVSLGGQQGGQQKLRLSTVAAGPRWIATQPNALNFNEFLAFCGYFRRVLWCPGAESNHRHCDFQSHALPTELPGPARPSVSIARLIGGAQWLVQGCAQTGMRSDNEPPLGKICRGRHASATRLNRRPAA